MTRRTSFTEEVSPSPSLRILLRRSSSSSLLSSPEDEVEAVATVHRGSFFGPPSLSSGGSVAKNQEGINVERRNGGRRTRCLSLPPSSRGGAAARRVHAQSPIVGAEEDFFFLRRGSGNFDEKGKHAGAASNGTKETANTETGDAVSLSQAVSDEDSAAAQQLLQAVQEEHWPSVVHLCELHPTAASHPVSVVLQGESSSATLLHEACRLMPTLDAIDALVTAHPASVVQGDTLGNRLPVHIAITSGASPAVVSYLLWCHPRCYSHKDGEGNAAIHHAAMFGSDEVLSIVLEAFVRGTSRRGGGIGGGSCAAANRRGRTPLHLLCSRCVVVGSNNASVGVQLVTFQSMLEANPDAIRTGDAHGHMPLHDACNTYSPRLDIIEVLLDAPGGMEAARAKDNHGRRPMDLLKAVRPELLCPKSCEKGGVHPTLQRLADAAGGRKKMTGLARTVLYKVRKRMSVHHVGNSVSSSSSQVPLASGNGCSCREDPGTFPRHASPVTTMKGTYTLPF